MNTLIIIVPTRGRPESVAKICAAWRETGAHRQSTLLFVIDGDDPKVSNYRSEIRAQHADWVHTVEIPAWLPMVKKLNLVAAQVAMSEPVYAIGFMGDDHLPRTEGWDGAFLRSLRGPSIAYGDDGYRGERLPTHWVMTADIIRRLGRMVPGAVEHLYCDDTIRDLGAAAGILHYLPDVLIEHMHPLAGKAETDAGYEQVNAESQYRKDHAAYRIWRAMGLSRDVEEIQSMIPEAG